MYGNMLILHATQNQDVKANTTCGDWMLLQIYNKILQDGFAKPLFEQKGSWFPKDSLDRGILKQVSEGTVNMVP